VDRVAYGLKIKKGTGAFFSRVEIEKGTGAFFDPVWLVVPRLHALMAV
jgi:hypothetical protein